MLRHGNMKSNTFLPKCRCNIGEMCQKLCFWVKVAILMGWSGLKSRISESTLPMPVVPVTMPPMKTVLFALAALLWFGPLASAIEPVIFKLYPFPPNGANAGFGLGIAVNERYIVVGDYRDSSQVEDGGAVYVIDARTRRILRRLVPNDLAAFDSFGYSVALWGDIVVVGAPFANEGLDADVGAVYVFNAKTGKQLGKFMASDGEASDELGTSVATNGELVLAGAPFAPTGRSCTG